MPVSNVDMTPEQMAALVESARKVQEQIGKTGTVNGATPAQNLAAVINQPGNPVAATPTPFITDTLNQAAKDTAAQQTPKPQGTFNPPSYAGDNPAQPPMTPVAATQSTPAPSQGSYPGQLTTAQIQAEAQARIDKQRAAITGATNAANAARKNVYDYTNQITGDSRTLENGAFNETHNPFTGQTGYAQANLQRNRGIQDTANNNAYQADITANNQKLTDFETLAPEQQQAILNDLTRQERDYGLQVGALTGQLNGQNTMQQNQNNFNNGIAQGNLTGNYTGPTGNQGMMSAQSYSPSTGGNNMGWQGQGQGVQTMASKQLDMQQQGQNFNQNMQTQQFAYTQARDAIKDKQYQQQFDMDNQKYGLDYALKQATLNNQITNDQAQRAIGYMNANTSQQNANTSSSNSDWAKDPNNPDNLYKQSEIAKNNAPKPKAADSYKTDPNFANDLAHLKKSPTDAAKLDSDPQPFITAYGYDGYLALRKAAGLQDPTAP